ncbi:carbonic anhydrase [Halolamina sediminis]|uniref:carbonic anhydrase n=1 Tax=Halolamina sediminis TaxID=1480675 RepID=UPI0006B63E7D|nr:carbonic anhydrase [Halolamina sediminis]
MDETFLDMLDRNADHAAAFDDRFDELQHGQQPDAVTVCCSDSRVLQDHIWGNDEPGHLFSCGNIGNRVVQRTDAGPRVSGDVLYPLAHTDTDLAVVLGHTGCGAVTATYDHLTDGVSEPAGIEHCIDLLAPGLEPGVETLPDGLENDEAVNRLVEYNVDRQVEFLLDSDDVDGSVQVVGAVYDFQDVYDGRRGEVHVINVDGETDPECLRDRHPAIDSRVDRLWTY